MGGRLGRQVLAAAKADLQPDPRGALRKQARGIERTARGQVHLQLRQQLLEQAPAPRPQSVAPAAAVDQALHGIRRGQA
jgi:hypothetical protein